MRIALAGTFSGSGGIQTHLRSLAKALSGSDHELLLLSFGGYPEDATAQNESSQQTKSRIVYLDEQRGAATRFVTAYRALWEFRPDIYLACGTGWNLFAAGIAGRVPRLIFNEVMSGEAGGWRDSRWLVRFCFDTVVAQAQPVSRNFARTFSWRGDLSVIPAFSDPLVNPTPVALARRSAAPFGRRAAFFGRLVPHKRALWLVAQWPRLQNCLAELHIFGSGPEEEAIRSLIEKNNWARSVFCHGSYPSGTAYAELLASIDLTLLPTIGAEGAPLVLLESMACGVPFVATDAGGISDYANPDCVIVPSTKPEDFLCGVERLAGDLAVGKIDHDRLSAFFTKHFSFDIVTAKWASLFDS